MEEWQCLVDLVAGQPKGNEHAKNKNHYVLATAEAEEQESRRRGFVEVRERARLVPGVPIVYVKRSVMVLEELSKASEGVRRGLEKGKFAEGILGGLGGRKRKRGDAEEELETDGNVDDGRAAMMKNPKAKGPKQPNPLSVPKKKKIMPEGKTEENPAVESAVMSEVADHERTEDVAIPSVKKGRKRRHGKKKAMDEFREALLEPSGDEPAETSSRLQDVVT